MGPGTSALLVSLYMAVLGAGIGLCMQVLTIAVQNTVDYADLGTATSGDGRGYTHTANGRREAELIRGAWTAWLEERVEQDIGRPPGTDLRAAVQSIAHRLLTEDETEGPRPVPVGAGRGVR